MGAQRVGLGLSAWREAWLLRRDNPLPRLWRLGQARAEQRRSWWRSAPGLTLLGVAVSAAVSYLLLLIIRQFLALDDSALATTSYALGMLRAGTLMLTCSAILLSGGWLLSRLYACAHLALSLLGRSGRKGSERLDDALLASAMSNEQVVLGLVLHAWRMLLPPAMLLNIANAAAYFVWVATSLGADAAQTLIPTIPWPETLLIALAFLLFQTLATLVGAALLLLLLLMLGREAGPSAPSTGAATLVVLQLGLWYALPVDVPMEFSDVAYTDWLLGAFALVPALLLFCSYFWVAHRRPMLRNATAHSLLVFIAALFVLFLGKIPTGPYYTAAFAGMIHSVCSWQVMSLSVLPAGGFIMLMIGAGLNLQMYSVAPIAASITLLQLALCFPLALLARDAVRLHRGGAA